MKKTKSYTDHRTEEINRITTALGEALQGSALTYTGAPARWLAEFIKDPTSPEAFAKVVVALSECHDQSKRSAR